MILFGSPTSPFVRRVRVYCAALDLPYEAVNVFTPAGQDRMRAHNPLWKVPTLVHTDGATQWDSQAILDTLIARHGLGPFRPPGEPLHEGNVHHAIFGALESAINVFYLRRDGVETRNIPYMVKQDERVDSALAWVAQQLHGASFVEGGGLGLLELSLFCVLDWMRFRNVRPVEENPAFAAFLTAHEGHPLLQATHPSQPFGA